MVNLTIPHRVDPLVGLARKLVHVSSWMSGPPMSAHDRLSRKLVEADKDRCREIIPY